MNDLIQHDPVIARLMQASTALAEAKSIQQTKTILDVAAAAEIYAKRQQLGEDAIGIAHTIKIDALRKLGEMLKATPRATGQFSGGAKMEPPQNPPKLADLGLDKKTSSIAQKLAELPEDAFEQVRDGHETVAKAIAAVSKAKAAAKPKKPKPAAQATPEPKPETPDETQELRAHIEELAATTKELLEENASMGAVIDADDSTAALYKQIKTLTATIAAVSAMRDQYMAECAQLKKQCAMYVKKLKAIEVAA